MKDEIESIECVTAMGVGHKYTVGYGGVKKIKCSLGYFDIDGRFF